jgi:hypothetical protein
MGLFGFEKERRIAIVINEMDRSVVFMRADLLSLNEGMKSWLQKKLPPPG